MHETKCHTEVNNLKDLQKGSCGSNSTRNRKSLWALGGPSAWILSHRLGDEILLKAFSRLSYRFVWALLVA